MAKTISPQRAQPEVYASELVDDDERVLDMMHGNAADLLTRAMDPINEREFKDIVEYEAFMAEGVTIMIHKTTDKNAPWVVPVGVNGDIRYFPRDVRMRVPRKFVEVLAKAQEEQLKTVQNRDHESDNAMTTTRQSASSYGFSVLHDPNPAGGRWLRRVTRQGC